ncbi:MAG: HAD-IA family hydrolase [Coxiellaceae bacterium]|nr:HAD-IA family hydrolase [Coxiellaceae bacterium]
MKALFFDLDGTLLDTAQDFAHTINIMLAKINKPPVDFHLFREQVHAESKRMISYAFNLNENDPLFEPIREDFLNTYHKNCTQKTVFFEDMEKVLDHLDEEKIPWGIITNKPTWLTTPIVKHFKLDRRASCIIAGDTLAKCKPDPLPLLYACERTNVMPTDAGYVGDLETDVLSARNAGMKSIAVSFGYHAPNTDLSTWGADHVVQTADDIMKLL